MDAIDRVPYDSCKPLEFRVLTKLANVAAQDGSRAFRSADEMANELGVSRRSIQRALKALEDDRFIIRGEQRHLAHLRADRRPIVYDINMPKCLNWDAYHGLELVPLDGTTEFSTGSPQSPENTGIYDATQFSTTGHDATHDTTAVVAQGTNRTNYLTSSKGNHTAPVTPRCAGGTGKHGALIVDGREIGCEIGCTDDYRYRLTLEREVVSS